MRTIIASTFILVGCSTTPEIIRLKDEKKCETSIDTSHHDTHSWGWVLWYVPVATIAIYWSYKEFSKKDGK